MQFCKNSFLNFPFVKSVALEKGTLRYTLHKCFSEQAYFVKLTGYAILFIVYNIFFMLQFFTPYHAILEYSTPDAVLVLYGKYSTPFPFDLPTQRFLNIHNYTQYIRTTKMCRYGYEQIIYNHNLTLSNYINYYILIKCFPQMTEVTFCYFKK